MYMVCMYTLITSRPWRRRRPPAAPPGKPRCLVSEGVWCLKVYDIISGPDRWQGSGVSPATGGESFVSVRILTCAHKYICSRAAPCPSHFPSPLAGIDQKYRDPATGLPISGINSFFFLQSTLCSYINSLYSYMYINSKFPFFSPKYSLFIYKFSKVLSLNHCVLTL